MVETDEEQLEVLKNWWSENGTSTITSILVVLGAVFGFRAWEDSVRESGEAASITYENLVQATSNLADENLRTTALSLGEQLKSEHDDSTYAAFAAMHLAKVAVEKNDLVQAQAQLEWVINQKPERHLETIARMRLARVLVSKGDAYAAMEKLSNYQPGQAQRASWEEVRGDVFVALGDNVNARQSYQIALENLGVDGSRPLLELKLADIPVSLEESQSEEDA